MIIRKVIGQNKIHPIRMSKTEHELVIKMGITLEQFIKEYLLKIASERKMTPREELVYRLRNDGMIYRLIGEQLGITGERARQIYCRCLRKIAKKASEK